MRRLLAPLAVISTVAVSLIVIPASPAAATQYSYACNPSETGWSVKARWDDGTVMEARACLQYWYNNSYLENFHRVRVEWRVRRGGTALSGTDWDLSPDYATYILTSDGSKLGEATNFTDTFNTSYIATYSGWVCRGPHQNYSGGGVLLRATPPGLSKSSYHSHWTSTVAAPTIACANG
jgi:hypothetical protein